MLIRCIKAVVSDSAFSVPPQQLITNDGGIIEVKIEIATIIALFDVCSDRGRGPVRDHRRGGDGQGGGGPSGYSQVRKYQSKFGSTFHYCWT